MSVIYNIGGIECLSLRNAASSGYAAMGWPLSMTSTVTCNDGFDRNWAPNCILDWPQTLSNIVLGGNILMR